MNKKTNITITRCSFLKSAGIGIASVALSACGDQATFPEPSQKTSPRPNRVTIPTSPSPALVVDLTASRTTMPILPGKETPVWHYQSSIRSGDPTSLQNLDGSYLGPIFRVKSGQRVQVKLKNDLPDPTIIHWHGLRIPEAMDGHPKYAIAPGQTYDYNFTVRNRAGLYWFHPHPHQLTGRQAYYGLAGFVHCQRRGRGGLGAAIW